MSTITEDATRLTFFELMFGTQEGWIEIANKAYNNNTFRQDFFLWPDSLEQMLTHISMLQPAHNIWFGTSLFTEPKRNKDYVTQCTTLWADLDTCKPETLEWPRPQIVMRSSPGRYQAIWCLDEPISPIVAEEYSRRLAYKYRQAGADISGWDLGQLLRVPLTTNFKHGEHVVNLINCVPDVTYPAAMFSDLPVVEGSHVKFDIAMPDLDSLRDVTAIIADYNLGLNKSIVDRLDNEPSPGEDWSKIMWVIEKQLFEAGMTAPEVFALMLVCKCNKFTRDNREPSYTWMDVCRAYSSYISNTLNQVGEVWSFPALVAESDIPTDPTFIERYVTWACTQTDAPAAYHEASAFIILSSILSATVRIPTSIGTMLPNLWVMILADTTLTRKTTSMDLALELVEEVIDDTVVATDGSVEGLLSALSLRPKKPSVFKRDEFTGLVDQMVKKDYMSGMLEMFTQLYDGKKIKRVLKKETIEVTEPIFLMYTGGIRNKMQSILTYEHISSGFIPRFLIISADSKLSEIRPMGRRTEESKAERNKLIAELNTYKARYVDDIMITTETGGQLMSAPDIAVELDDEAWTRYNDIENQLLQAGIMADLKEFMTPIFDRMAKNMLKMAALIAAVRQIPEHGIIQITVADINRAAGFIQKWAVHTMELVAGLGATNIERQLQTCLKYIEKHPGCWRSEVMRTYRVSAFDMENFIKTMEQRALIRTERSGKGQKIWAL